METTHVYAEITKAEKQADGTMLVSGPVSTSGLDRDQQRCNDAWLDRAVPTWFGEGGNIREQHSHIAAGKALSYWKADNGQHMVEARVVDPVSVTKVEHNVLTGFSIGIKGARVVKSATAPGGEIVDGKIIEVSLVDRPSNPECLLVLAKSDETGHVAPLVEDQEFVVLSSGPDEQPETDAAPVVPAPREVPVVEVKADEAADTKADDREEPPTVTEVVASAVSQVSDEVREAARGVLDTVAGWAIPERPTDKADSDNIAGAQDAIAAIARLIQTEASGLADGDLSEAGDISCLLEAVSALRYFIAREESEGEVEVVTLAEDSDTAKADSAENGGTVNESAILSDEGLTAKIEQIVAAQLTKAEELHKAEVETLRSELAEVKAQPTGGGPVRVRVGADRAKADEVDRRSLLDEAAEYIAKAENADDPSVADGYRAIARDLREKAAR